MGVHYFYTWVTRRYPLFKKTYDPEIMPEIDNFFLDLNGVLYKCAKDDKALYRDILKGKNMDEIFASIFNYINKLINYMRPRKRIFIAIDGVAPRAKMNNQRQRRYHSARSNKSLNEFLMDDLKTNPGVVSFKNNSISPGTEFMFELIDRIKFFIQRKIHEDDNWKGLEVIMSGGDVPGEGEHKLMEWLRGWKQSKDYDVNETHVIYSNDADLIFLSLSLHVPKMMILREVMEYDDDKTNSATKRTSSEQQMELLFIGVLREYMELEYNSIRGKFTKNPFDIERIIDDFILLAFFIGNDFLHQLYCMSTKFGNFDEVIDIFKEQLPKLNGYLSDKGKVNWENFIVFLRSIVKMENKMIKTTLDEMNDLVRETKASKKLLFKKPEKADMDEDRDDNQRTPQAVIRRDNSGYEGDLANLDSNSEDEKDKDAGKMNEEYIEKTDKGASSGKGDDLKKLTKNYELEMQEYYVKIKNESAFVANLLSSFSSGDAEMVKNKKSEFYERFFGIKDLNLLDKVILDYAKGVQFVMYYYFYGCPSWTWYYPYFLSPFLSDLVSGLERNVSKLNFTFDQSGPYRPYDQLAYILPKASFGLLPPIYSEILAKDPRTAKYYPDDLNDFEPFDGLHDYEWIAKLELFDDKVMSEVLKSIPADKMTEVERNRNNHGIEQVYKYDSSIAPISVATMIKGLPDFKESIKITPFNTLEKYPFDPAKITIHVEGVNSKDGYPSLKIIPGVEGSLQQIKKKNGNYRRLILKIFASSVQRQGGPYTSYVFYDYPFKKIGHINAIVSQKGVEAKGNLQAEVVASIVEEKRARSSLEIFNAIRKESLFDHFKDKGIDYDDEGLPGGETYYSIEFRKSAWRTAKDMDGTIIYEFEHVPDIIPTGMLQAFSLEEFKAQDTEYKFPINENELFKPNTRIVSLFNGDFLKISNPQPKNDPINIYGDIIKPNNNLSKEVVTAADLLEDRWTLVDQAFLKILGLELKEQLVLYGLLDSFVIRTDQTKTSSLILGQLFDIGLKFFKALGMNESKVLIVIDLIK